MEDAMVTGRMSAEKKAAGNAVLEKAGFNASQAINALYDRLVETKSVDFLFDRHVSPQQWKAAAKVVDSIASPVPIHTRFDDMTRGQIKLERAKSRGLV